jgi:hypothetical protein
VDNFKAKYLEIQPREIVRHVLKESGQDRRDAINVSEVLTFLGLEFFTFDFDSVFLEQAKAGGKSPRALLSFQDRIVATDSSLSHVRERFSVLHEVAHYVLPNHQYEFFLCDKAALAGRSNLVLEMEASELAADLLFQGDRFTLEANSLPIKAATIKSLAAKYNASFESTARRLVEKSVRPCMLISFRRTDDGSRIDLDAPPVWRERYCVASVSFGARFFTAIEGAVPPAIALELMRPGRDIADGVVVESEFEIRKGEKARFHTEFFYNKYNIFAILTPSGK